MHARPNFSPYTTFETEINPIANQKVEVKTHLAKSDQPLADPSLKGETPATPPPSPGSVPQR